MPTVGGSAPALAWSEADDDIPDVIPGPYDEPEAEAEAGDARPKLAFAEPEPVERRPVQPVFQGDRIVLQLVRLPQPAFSAALTAYVEARYDDDEHRNRLCGTVPFPYDLDDYPATMLATMWNQFHWGQDAELRRWIRASRLDGFGKLMAEADRDDPAQRDVLARIREHAPGAVGNLTRLVEARSASA